jgi:hypothetical protein
VQDEPPLFAGEEQSKLDPATRREELKLKLLSDSQSYYQNNMNVFVNGLSLLAVNSLEMHGYVHQVQAQSEQLQTMSLNVEAHSNFVRQKSESMHRKLLEIQRLLRTK